MFTHQEMVEWLVCLELGDGVFDKDRCVTSAWQEKAIEETYRHYDKMSDSELSELLANEMCY